MPRWTAEGGVLASALHRSTVCRHPVGHQIEEADPMRPIRSTSLLVLLAAAAACGDGSPTAARQPHAAPVRMAAAGAGIADAYLVVLNDGADPRGLARALGIAPRFVYA